MSYEGEKEREVRWEKVWVGTLTEAGEGEEISRDPPKQNNLELWLLLSPSKCTKHNNITGLTEKYEFVLVDF